MQRLEEKSSTSVEDRTLFVQSIVSHYTDLATPAPKILMCIKIKRSHTLIVLFTDFIP
jgi:hypothetical protein